MLKSRFFWLNLISLVVLIVTYFLQNNMFSQYVLWEGLIIAVLNAIAGMLKDQEVTKLKSQVAKAKKG